jgi:hypothetical protein
LEEDVVAEEAEACSSVHLSFDQFGLGVDAFGAAVVVSAGQGCVDTGTPAAVSARASPTP